VRVEGRKISFAIEVHDERDLIGEGSHERVVVNVAKFDLRVQEKIQLLTNLRADK
jgi:predicted thioesterase